MKEKKFLFLMNEEEMGLLKEVVFLEPFLQDVVKHAKKINGRYRVKFLLNDFKKAIDTLSFAAGSVATYLKNEKMRSLQEKMEAYLILRQVF